MNLQEVEITIDKEGKVQVAARGARGEGCLGLTKKIENAVGTTEDREYTAEYYEQPVSIDEHVHVADPHPIPPTRLFSSRAVVKRNFNQPPE